MRTSPELLSAWLKSRLLLLLFCALSNGLLAQAFPIFNGSYQTCTGAFLDSGGQGGGYGLNDGFMPVFNEPDLVQDYEFKVFDRWGELLFNSSTPHEFWNGEFKGAEVKQDVYVWQLIYKDSRSFEKLDLYGHVTVIR